MAIIMFSTLSVGAIVYAAAFTTPNVFNAGDIVSSADMNANFQAIKLKLDELDARQYASAPEGTIVAFGGTTVPAGWRLCNGDAVDRAGDYAYLFAVIGIL